MVHAVVVYQSGALYVEDFGATQPLWLFAPSASNGLANLLSRLDSRDSLQTAAQSIPAGTREAMGDSLLMRPR